MYCLSVACVSVCMSTLLCCFRGEGGRPGPSGSQGATGRIGDTGSSGPVGFTGPQGQLGFTGETGFTGLKGTRGEIGSSGDTGSTGFSGLSCISLTAHQNQNQNVNVYRAIRNQLEVSLVYCTNQTKGLMEKLKTKPRSRPVSVKAVR